MAANRNKASTQERCAQSTIGGQASEANDDEVEMDRPALSHGALAQCGERGPFVGQWKMKYVNIHP
jgi:hypothetical protein